MNIRSLKVFVLVMEEGTLARAAQTMNLSQSAASRLLHLLEQEFSITLFHRDKKRLVPTVEGERFYGEALRILSQIEALPNFARQIQTGAAEPFRIIAQSRIVNGLVLPAIAEFASQFPDQPVRLEIHPRRDLGRRLMHDRFDVGVSALPLSIDQPEPVRLGAVTLKVALRPDHPLAQQSVLTPQDLTALPYIALDDTTVIRRVVDRAMEAMGVQLQLTHEVSVGAAAYRLVRFGLGFTFADPVALDPELMKDVKLVDFDPSLTIEIGCFLSEASRKPALNEAYRRILQSIFHNRTQAPVPAP